MRRKPRILLVNDDGAQSPGLWALFREIQAIATPVVVAPMHEQSARSHAITLRRQMALAGLTHRGRPVGWQLDGSPADCVKLALAQLYRGELALVISGINWGSNVGHNVLYSGTVAAALEGAMYGLPALAISLRDELQPPIHYATAARVARRLALDVLAHGLPAGVILNVNVPNLPWREIAGAAVTRQGQEVYIDLFEFLHEGGRIVSCTNVGGERRPSRSGDHVLDDLALSRRFISITPLHYDLTCHPAVEAAAERLAETRLTAGRQKRK